MVFSALLNSNYYLLHLQVAQLPAARIAATPEHHDAYTLLPLTVFGGTVHLHQWSCIRPGKQQPCGKQDCDACGASANSISGRVNLRTNAAW